jgi:hypothetical protein
MTNLTHYVSAVVTHDTKPGVFIALTTETTNQQTVAGLLDLHKLKTDATQNVT